MSSLRFQEAAQETETVFFLLFSIPFFKLKTAEEEVF